MGHEQEQTTIMMQIFKIKSETIRIFLSSWFFMNFFFLNSWNHFHALLQPIWMFRGFKSVWRSIYNAYALALFTVHDCRHQNGRLDHFFFFALVQHCFSKSFSVMISARNFFQTWSILGSSHVFETELGEPKKGLHFLVHFQILKMFQ